MIETEATCYCNMLLLYAETFTLFHILKSDYVSNIRVSGDVISRLNILSHYLHFAEQLQEKITITHFHNTE